MTAWAELTPRGRHVCHRCGNRRQLRDLPTQGWMCSTCYGEHAQAQVAEAGTVVPGSSTEVLAATIDPSAPVEAKLARLRELEAEIHLSLSQAYTELVAAGIALGQIREHRLYEANGWKSWRQYVEDRFGFSGRRADQLIAFVAVQGVLLAAEVKTPPTAESQVRALVPYVEDDPEIVVEVWEAAEEIAGDGGVTAVIVGEALEQVVEADSARPKSWSLSPTTNVEHFVARLQDNPAMASEFDALIAQIGELR